MRAGLLTEQIHILRPIIVTSETGSQETVYDSCIRTRAYVVYNYGSRSALADEIIYPHTVTFQIRRFASFDESYHIKWEDNEYRILSIERHKHDQKIIAEKIEC